MIDNVVDKYLNEASLSRVYQHIEEHDAGIMTSFRDGYTKKENLQRNKSLKAKLSKYGFTLISAKGKFIEGVGTGNEKEVGENVFIVVDINDSGVLKSALAKLGEEFDQDSVLFLPKGHKNGILIGTSKEKGLTPSYKQEIQLGKPLFGKKGEVFTRVKGRPFILESEGIHYIHHSGGFMGAMARCAIAGKHWSEVPLNEYEEDSLKDDVN